MAAAAYNRAEPEREGKLNGEEGTGRRHNVDRRIRSYVMIHQLSQCQAAPYVALGCGP